MGPSFKTAFALLAAFLATVEAFPPPASVKGFFDSTYITPVEYPEPTATTFDSLVTREGFLTTTSSDHPSPTATTFETLVTRDVILTTTPTEYPSPTATTFEMLVTRDAALITTSLVSAEQPHSNSRVYHRPNLPGTIL
ncbi:hypothetical protein LTR65_006781 [Meristemomyces frigidus]